MGRSAATMLVALVILAPLFIPALGIAGPWTLFVLSLHAIWSVTASIVLALGAAALLTYAWHAFPENPVLPATPAADVVGNAVFAAAAVVVIAIAAARTRSHRGAIASS